MSREIRFYRTHGGFLIPRINFARVVKDVMKKLKPSFLCKVDALEVLQESTEAFLVHFLSESNICRQHAKRATLMITDMELIRELKYKYQ